MPFSDIYKLLLEQGSTPLVRGGSASPPGATPPFLPPTQRPVGGFGSTGPGPGAPSGQGGLLQRLLAGAFPTSDASGLTTPEQQQAAQRQGLLSFGTSLLANSGAQPGPRRGLGQLVGQALQEGQGAASGSIKDQLDALLLKSRIQQTQAGGAPPALVAEYEYAKKAGFPGSFEEYQRFKADPTSGSRRINPNAYTPESFAKYQQSGDPRDLVRYNKPLDPVLTSVAGVPGFALPTRDGSATFNGLSTPEDEFAAAEERARRTAQGTATGQTNAALAAKQPVLDRFNYSLGEIRGQIEETLQGGPLGVLAAAGNVFDYGDATRFDSIKENLSTDLRAAFRIPGEGTLTDQEQRQYGLQLPDRRFPPSVNKAISGDLEQRMLITLGQAPASQSAPTAQPRQPARPAPKPSTKPAGGRRDYSKATDADLRKELGL